MRLIATSTTSTDTDSVYEYDFSITVLNGQVPYFIDWSQYAYLEREVNSGYTVIEIPRSAFAGGLDFYLLEVKF